MGPGWRWRAQIWSIWIENELIKRFKTLPGPGEAQKNQKLPKWAKTEKSKKIRIFSPYETPDQPLWAAYIRSMEILRPLLVRGHQAARDRDSVQVIVIQSSNCQSANHGLPEGTIKLGELLYFQGDHY